MSNDYKLIIRNDDAVIKILANPDPNKTFNRMIILLINDIEIGLFPTYTQALEQAQSIINNAEFN